jgi:ADP-ribosylglycohydrolase
MQQRARSGSPSAPAADALAAAALLVAWAVEKRPPAVMREALVEHFASRSVGLRVALAAGARSFSEVLSAKGASTHHATEKSVVDAWRCFADHPERFEAALQAAAEHPARSREVAMLVGGISGAFNGAEAVPDVERVPHAARLRALGHRLWVDLHAERTRAAAR